MAFKYYKLLLLISVTTATIWPTDINQAIAENSPVHHHNGNKQQDLTANGTIPQSCHLMSQNELNLMPGWKRLRLLIINQFKKEIKAIHFIKEGFDQYRAEICSSGEKALFDAPIDGGCQNAKSELVGTMMNEGLVSTTIYTGFEASTALKVAHASTFGLGLEVGITTNFFLAKIDQKISFSTTVTNTQENTVKTQSSTAVQNTVRLKPVIGQQCSIKLTQEQCSFTSNGYVPLIAKGYIWVELEGPDQNDETRAIALADYLKEDERSVNIGLSAAIITKAQSQFYSKCICVDGPCKFVHHEPSSSVSPNNNITANRVKPSDDHSAADNDKNGDNKSIVNEAPSSPTSNTIEDGSEKFNSANSSISSISSEDSQNNKHLNKKETNSSNSNASRANFTNDPITNIVTIERKMSRRSFKF